MILEYTVCDMCFSKLEDYPRLGLYALTEEDFKNNNTGTVIELCRNCFNKMLTLVEQNKTH